jgi:hypothetical protein
MNLQEAERFADGELRRTRSAEPRHYLEHWLKVWRPFGLAARTDTWGELEQILRVVFGAHVVARKHLATLFPNQDPRFIHTEQIRLLVELRERHTQPCPRCHPRFPGQHLEGCTLATCLQCGGSGRIARSES